MKIISIEAYELTREEVQNMEDGQTVLVYNPESRDLVTDLTGEYCIACSKHAKRNLIYISLDEKPNIKFKEEQK